MDKVLPVKSEERQEPKSSPIESKPEEAPQSQPERAELEKKGEEAPVIKAPGAVASAIPEKGSVTHTPVLNSNSIEESKEEKEPETTAQKESVPPHFEDVNDDKSVKSEDTEVAVQKSADQFIDNLFDKASDE